MGRCARVGCTGDDKLGYTCRYCDRHYCAEHRLPENHACSGLRADPLKRATPNPDRVASFTPGWALPGTRPPKAESIGDPSPETAPDGSLVSPGGAPPRSRDGKVTSSIGRVLRRLGGVIKTVSLVPVVVVVFLIALLRAYWRLLLVGSVVIGLGIGFGLVSAATVLPDDPGTQIDEGLRGLVTDGTQFVANVSETGDGSADGSTDSSTAAPPGSDDDGGATAGIDSEVLETHVHAEINDVRRDHGLSPLVVDSELGRIAAYHSQDMAETGYFAHDSPAGETMSDRYDRFGYDCRVPVGGNRYATGAENIFRVTARGGTLDESRLAVTVVEGWMNSPGHRENILRAYWGREGIGVATVTDGAETAVYVTQNFC